MVLSPKHWYDDVFEDFKDGPKQPYANEGVKSIGMCKECPMLVSAANGL